MEERIYVSLYDEDSFDGISVPKELESIIVDISKNTKEIDEIFYNYGEYRDYETECSHYAKDGSRGTKKLDTVDDLLKKFERNSKVCGIILKYKN